MKPIIIILAYSRPISLKRLLGSIELAEYPEGVELIISLEGEASGLVREIANNFVSAKVAVSVMQRPYRLGLRKHVIACGDMALEHGSVIILEDDLVVDKYFYQYALAALNYYDGGSLVAGIALYSLEYNEYAGQSFRPMLNGYATYPMQVPCSWGQCWSAKQWAKFKAWYATADTQIVNETKGLPEVVKCWPESSWKKYYAAYMVRHELFFINPYQAYTTNCSDPGGTHIPRGSNIHQVNMASQERLSPEFEFCPIDEFQVAYDAFFEPCGDMVYRLIGLDRQEVDIDTLGIKPESALLKEYILTSRRVLKAINGYPRSFRPIEYNLNYVLSDEELAVLSLALRADCLTQKRAGNSFDDYSYYSGVDLKSTSVLTAIFRAFPRLLFEKLKYIILK